MSELCFAVFDPPDGLLANVRLTLAKPPDRNGVIVSFKGIAGNRPLTFGNYLALWDTGCPIIGVDEPVATASIESNLQPGSVAVAYPHFAEGDYCVTYQVGASLQSMCAELKIAARLQLAPVVPTSAELQIAARLQLAPVVPTSAELSLVSVTTRGIELDYNTIQGYRPRDFGNWLGIWRGNPVVYAPGDPPLGHATFDDDATQGMVTISGVTINPQCTYTVVYFLSGADTLTAGHDVAAAFSFATGDTV